jgi:DNA-binding HxlR family transcriptional regulator
MLMGMSHTDEPRALAWSTENCTVARAMAVLGERWTIVVLREVFNGVRRFDQIRDHAGIPRQVLANRLAALCEAGVLRREPYRAPGERERHEYRLTAKGLDLYPVLIAVKDWGDRYLADPAGPPLEISHRDCGEPVRLRLVCGRGHVLESARAAQAAPGPGAIPRTGPPAVVQR